MTPTIWIELIIQLLQGILENCPAQARDRDSVRKMLTKPTMMQKVIMRRESRKQLDEQLDSLSQEFAGMSAGSNSELEYILDQLCPNG